MKISVCNFKGGTTKSTTTAHLLAALDAAGMNPLGVDADPPGSLMRWADLGAWEIPVIQMASKAIHKTLPQIIGDDFDSVVIDTPPLEDQAGIVYSALRAADVVLIPLAPTMMDLDRLPPILAALEEVRDTTERDLPAAVILTRTVANAISTSTTREAVEERGLHVLASEVPRREIYAQSFGQIVKLGANDVHHEAIKELKGLIGK